MRSVLEEFQIEQGLLVKYRGRGGQVVIPDGVVSIRGNALSECGAITAVSFPDTLKTVGEFAFNNCETLDEVYVPSLSAWLAIDFQGFRANPLSNGAKLFIGGEEAVHLVVPSGIEQLGQRAFEGCTSLEQLVLPSSVKSIGKLAFGACPSLEAVMLPEGLQEIGYAAFRGCSALVSADFPASLTRISSWAFAQCTSLISLSLPEGLEVLERDAFYGCTALGFVRLPSTLSKLPDDVFYGCSSLGSLRVPSKAAAFGSNVFARCAAIREIWLEGPSIPESFQPPASLEVLIAPDVAFSSCWRTSLQQPLAAGFVKLAAQDRLSLTADCAAYVSLRVPDLLKALRFEGPSVKWFLQQGLIPEGEEAAFAAQAASLGQMEAAALLLEGASALSAAPDLEL